MCVCVCVGGGGGGGTCIVMIWGCAIIWALFGLLPDFGVPVWGILPFLGTFLGHFRIFGYHFWLFPDFWVSFVLVKFDFFKNKKL